MKVKIYSTPSCTWCHRTKDFLKENKISFEDIDVSTNAKARDEMVSKSGQLGVPVIETGKEILIGFDETKLRKLLNIK